jgi:hypothetical protein
MRFLVRWAFRLFILLLVMAVALVLLKDVLAKAAAEHQIRSRSGLEVKIGSLELGLSAPTLTVEDMKIFNPAEFGGSPLLDIPDLHIEYDLRALAGRQIHLRLVRLALTEVNIVEAKDGRTNIVLGLDTFTSGRPGANAFFGWDFAGIDTLNLSVGKVKYTSLRRPENATDVVVGLRNEVYTNVKSLAELQNLVTRTLFRNGITITSKPPADRRNTGPRVNKPGGRTADRP